MTLFKHTNRQKSVQVLLSSLLTNPKQFIICENSLLPKCCSKVLLIFLSWTGVGASSRKPVIDTVGAKLPESSSVVLSSRSHHRVLQAELTQKCSLCSISVSAFADKLSPYYPHNPNNNNNSNNYILKLHELICDCCSVFWKLELWCLKCLHQTRCILPRCFKIFHTFEPSTFCCGDVTENNFPCQFGQSSLTQDNKVIEKKWFGVNFLCCRGFSSAAGTSEERRWRSSAHLHGGRSFELQVSRVLLSVLVSHCDTPERTMKKEII